jgi:hypothetical protein
MLAENEKRFESALKKIIGINRVRQGIGTQGEKTLHAVMKHYYAPDEDMHEIPIDSYIADIYTGREIIEIQTAGMIQMRGKLSCFLPQYPVTIVHPLPHKKLLYWIDEKTGECVPPRKSPKTGSIYDIFRELYWIKDFLTHENLRFCFPFVNIEEYRLLNGWSRDRKRGSHRFDRVPSSLEHEIHIECREDYLQFIPYELPEPFTSVELGKMVKINKSDAARALNVLHAINIVERVGKKGNAYLYVVCT